MHSLGDHPGAEAAAFSATVFVIIDLLDLLHLPGWLERGGHPAPRRAKALRQLGEALTNTDWLVDGYYGLHLQRSSNRLVEDATLTAQIAKLEQRLSDVRTGPLGAQALGEWPWTHQANAEVVIEHEITSLERLKALSEPPR
jgi:hypothetical protein